MSQLTKALNTIYMCLKHKYPKIAAKLPPGLSPARTKEVLPSLPYKLPQEIYELYQFCRGWNWETENWDTIFSPWYGTMTLRSPITIQEDLQHFETYKVRYLDKPLVPIFGFDRIYLCVVGNSFEKYSSPILYVSELNEVELHYVSLTSMMQTVAESWQTGSVHINDEDFVECDQEKFLAFCRKYNSELPQMVLKRLRDELEIAKSNNDRLCKIWNSVHENVRWLTMCWPSLSIEQFDFESIQPIVKEIINRTSDRERTVKQHFDQSPSFTSLSSYETLIEYNCRVKSQLMSQTQLFPDLSPEEVRDVKAFIEYRRALDQCGYRPVVGASRGSKTKLLKSGDSSVTTFVDEVIAHDGLAATVVPDLRTKAKLRGLKARENMLNYQGSPWKSDLVANYLGITVQMVSRKRRSHKLLGVSFGKKEYLYPSWQFVDNGILQGMETLLSALSDELVPDWDKLCFFVSGDERLGGDSPVVALQTGRVDQVLAIAKVYGRQLS